jgi:NitT/TauT family transport system substrate-binding protein
MNDSILFKRAIGVLISGVFLSLVSVHVTLGADRLRIGLSSVSPINGAIWVAEEKGIFQKYGIDPEVILIGGASAAGVGSLIAGDIQFLIGGGSAVINADLNGADVVMIASVVNKGIQRVMAQSDLKAPEDLKGKKVGITRFGASSHMVLLMMLRRWGMSPSEIQIFQVGSSPAMMASLEKGGIDAAVLTEPTFFVAEDQGYRVLADLAKMDIYYLHSMVDTTRSYLESHRELATRFMKAYLEGIAFFKRHRSETLEVLRKKMRTKAGQVKFLERSYALYASGYFESAPYPSLEGVRTVLEFLAKNKPNAAKADPNSFIDGSLVKELDDSGFIKKLYQ